VTGRRRYHRRTGHFWRGAGSLLPEKYGAAPEKWTPELTWLNRTRQESLTTSIVENRRRTYIYIYTVLSSSIFVKHAQNSHFAARKNARLPEKNILPDSGGLQLHQLIRLWALPKHLVDLRPNLSLPIATSFSFKHFVAYRLQYMRNLLTRKSTIQKIYYRWLKGGTHAATTNITPKKIKKHTKTNVTW